MPTVELWQGKRGNSQHRCSPFRHQGDQGCESGERRWARDNAARCSINQGHIFARGDISPEVDGLLHRVLLRLVAEGGIKIRVGLEVTPEGGWLNGRWRRRRPL